jgi:hypothetical protein
MALNDLRLAGTYRWYRNDRWEEKHPLEISLDANRRTGMISTVPVGETPISDGTVSLKYPGLPTDFLLLDVYALYAIAVFEPADFKDIQETIIQESKADGVPDDAISVYELTSAKMSLYFSRKDHRLRRIDLRNAAKGRVYGRVELGRYQEYGTAELPTAVRVQLLERRRFSTDDRTPSVIEFLFDAEVTK